MMNCNNHDIVLYKVKDVHRIIGCGRNTAYKIFQSPDFPRIRIGGQYYVEKEEFEKWLDSKKG